MMSQGYLPPPDPDLKEIVGYALPNVDSDGDGLIDGFERLIGTMILNPDSDADGVSDGQELPGLRWVEVDLPEMVAYKEPILRGEPPLPPPRATEGLGGGRPRRSRDLGRSGGQAIVLDSSKDAGR